MLEATTFLVFQNFRSWQPKQVETLTSKLDAGGKPSTWLPPGRLVELLVYRIKYDYLQKLTQS